MVSRALKKAETRELLIRAAGELFHRKGFEGTTVDDIVGLAGVSQRTFFRYFASKLDVAFPHHETRLGRLNELIEQSFDPSNPVRSVQKALMQFSSDYQEAREELLREYDLINNSPLLLAKDLELDSHWEALIARTLVRGGLPQLEAAVLAGAIFGALRASTHHWFMGGCTDNLMDLGKPTFQLLDSLSGAFEQKPGLFGRKY